MYDTELYYDFQNPTWRRKAFEFCTLSTYGPCSLLLFNSFDSTTHSVSDYNYQLRFGACRDTFTSRNWSLLLSQIFLRDFRDTLANTPPTQLTQTYYQCTQEVTLISLSL
jgi:hypothetical protein